MARNAIACLITVAFLTVAPEAENFTDFLPMELADIERLVQEKGVVQKVPPIPANAIRSSGSSR